MTLLNNCRSRTWTSKSWTWEANSSDPPWGESESPLTPSCALCWAPNTRCPWTWEQTSSPSRRKTQRRWAGGRWCPSWLKWKTLGYSHLYCDIILFCICVCRKDSGGQWLEEKRGGHVWNGRKEENVWCSTVNEWMQSTSANMQVCTREPKVDMKSK